MREITPVINYLQREVKDDPLKSSKRILEPRSNANIKYEYVDLDVVEVYLDKFSYILLQEGERESTPVSSIFYFRKECQTKTKTVNESIT